MLFTLSKYRSLIRSAINEPTQAAITDTELNAMINDAYRDTAVMGLCSEVSGALTLRDGWKFYDLPAGSGQPLRAGYVFDELGGVLTFTHDYLW